MDLHIHRCGYLDQCGVWNSKAQLLGQVPLGTPSHPRTKSLYIPFLQVLSNVSSPSRDGWILDAGWLPGTDNRTFPKTMFWFNLPTQVIQYLNVQFPLVLEDLKLCYIQQSYCVVSVSLELQNVESDAEIKQFFRAHHKIPFLSPMRDIGSL